RPHQTVKFPRAAAMRFPLMRTSAGTWCALQRALGAASGVWLLVSTLPELANAQLSGSNLLEAQVGNYPHRQPSNRQDLYDQLNLEYGFGMARAGVRFETDRNSEQQFAYEGLSQRYVDWTDGRYRVRVGNFYTILGRGL